MNNEEFNVAALADAITELREKINEMREMMLALGCRKDNIQAGIKIDRATAEDLLGVSTSTLQRWRKLPAPNNLPCRVNPNGTVYFMLDELYAFVKSGKGRLDRPKVLSKLQGFKEGAFSVAFGPIGD